MLSKRGIKLAVQKHANKAMLVVAIAKILVLFLQAGKS